MDGNSGSIGPTWKLERQQNSTVSHQTTRVLKSEIRLSSTANSGLMVDDFPLIKKMDGNNPDDDLVDMLRQKMQMSSDNFSSKNFQTMSQFMNNSGHHPMMSKPMPNSGLEIDGGLTMNMIQGQTRNKGEHIQAFADSRSATVQSTTKDPTNQEIPPWLEEKLRQGGLLNGNQKITATATQKRVLISNSSVAGMTRSYSSNSGFPSTMMNSVNELEEEPGHVQVEEIGPNGELTQLTRRNSPPSLALPLSPRRTPFTFRNFEGPLWTDNNFPMVSDLLEKNNRKTWDPSSDLKVRTSVQFSASQSQHIFESSSNGSFRAAAYQDRVFLRQSYGPSESEESDDEDDDFIIKRSIVGGKDRPALKYKPRLALLDKPSAPSEDDTGSSVAPSEIDIRDVEPIDDIKYVAHQTPPSPENNQKAYKVANELVETERTYVKILHLIDQVFHFRVAQENRAQQIFPPETLNQIFCNIKSIYTLHHDHLLPRLEERLERWNDDPRIGDIMVEFSPFLKMYSEYVQNFDNSLNLINYYKEKNVRFMNVINDIQNMPECLNLPLQHHLIAPIQRIPRYRLLLEAYLKRLSNESNDKKDTEQALNIVSKAAEHANEAMRRIVSFKKLLEAQEQIRGLMDLVSPTRIMIKEGKISKISARTTESSVRYLFLLSDMILLCSSRSTYLSGQKYQLRAKLDIAEISVYQGDDLEIMNTFYIEDATRRIELFTDREDEKRDWMEAIYKAKMDLMERKSSLRLSDDFIHDLGLQEPAMIKKEIQLKCMLCDITFTMLKRRKHHCHACGIVVCAKCSNSKMPLQYANGKLSRICDPCKIILQGKEAEKRKSANDSGLSSPDDSADRVHGILDVPATDPSVLCGYLNLRLRGRKEWGQSKDTWIPRYFCLRADFVLYSYAKHTDDKALCATPIPSMSIQMADELNKNDGVTVPASEKDRSFRMTHSHGRKTFFFCAPARDEALTWVRKLTQASLADMSGPTSPVKEGMTSPSSSEVQR